MNTIDNNKHLIPPLSSSTQWHTKIFAIECVRRLLTYCEQSTLSHLHFDHQIDSNGDYLVSHLNILINLSLIACRSSSNPLRSAGLTLLQHIIIHFSSKKKFMDPTDHILLQDYQAQICAALRPSFSPNTSSHLTTQACEVCSTWISTSMGPDLRDLRRAHQLLISSLRKLISIQTCHDENSTMENLAILKVWADVYNLIMTRKNEQKDNPYLTFFNLLQTEFDILIYHWLAAVTDYAILILPAEFGGIKNITHDGNFYSTRANEDRVKQLYQATGISFIQAVIHWLNEHNYEIEILKSPGYNRQDVFLTKLFTLTISNDQRMIPEKKENLFHLLLGCCVQALSTTITEQTDETMEAILSALSNLIQTNLAIDQITINISIEIMHVLQR